MGGGLGSFVHVWLILKYSLSQNSRFLRNSNIFFRCWDIWIWNFAQKWSKRGKVVNIVIFLISNMSLWGNYKSGKSENGYVTSLQRMFRKICTGTLEIFTFFHFPGSQNKQKTSKLPKICPFEAQKLIFRPTIEHKIEENDVLGFCLSFLSHI